MTVSQNVGFHPILETDHPYVFIDGCMQAWPDADFDNAHRHGATGFCITTWRPHAIVEDALEDLMFRHLTARKHPNTLVVERAADIRQAKQDRRAAFILAAQGGEWIEHKLHRVEAFHRLGLRMLIPAYNRANGICTGCLDRYDSGLTRFGDLVVDECNRVGLLLDCTHVGRRSSLDIIERSQHPVVFSHSNPKAVVDNPRNIDDEQIRACVANGGVIGLAPWGPLVQKQGNTAWPPLDHFIDHVDYVTQLTGSSSHIGIGTDMPLGTYPTPLQPPDPWGEPKYPGVAEEYGKLVTADPNSRMRSLDGFSSYPEVVNLIETLQRRGYSDRDVHNILGENYLRVFAQVWGG